MPALNLLDIFRAREAFRRDSLTYENLTDILVVLNMFPRNFVFGFEIIFIDIEVRYFIGKILGLYGDGWQEISQGALLGNA